MFLYICWFYSIFLISLTPRQEGSCHSGDQSINYNVNIFSFMECIHSLDLNDSSLMKVPFQPFIQYQNSMEIMRTFYYFLLWLKWEGPILCILKEKNLLQSLTNRVLHAWHRRQRKMLFPENLKTWRSIVCAKKSHRWDWIYFSFVPQIIEQWKLAAFWHSVTIWAVGKKMSAVIHKTTLNSHQFQSQPKTGYYQAKIVKNIQKTSNMDPSFCP